MKKPASVSNVLAKDLRTPKYAPRVVRDRTKYTRKGRKPNTLKGDNPQ